MLILLRLIFEIIGFISLFFTWLYFSDDVESAYFFTIAGYVIYVAIFSYYRVEDFIKEKNISLTEYQLSLFSVYRALPLFIYLPVLIGLCLVVSRIWVCLELYMLIAAFGIVIFNLYACIRLHLFVDERTVECKQTLNHPHLLDKVLLLEDKDKKVFVGKKIEKASFLELIKRVQIFKKLNYPFFPKYEGIYSDSNHDLVLVMEYIKGTTLVDILNDSENFQKKYSEYDLINILIKIISSIDVMHKRGILHRDIAPRNIMIKEDRSIKVIDFDHSTQKSNRIIPQPLPENFYLGPEHAPELNKRGRQDERLDYYSFGYLVKRFLEEFTFSKTTKKALEKLSSTLLRKNPNERYQNAFEILRVLYFLEENTVPVFREIVFFEE